MSDRDEIIGPGLWPPDKPETFWVGGVPRLGWVAEWKLRQWVAKWLDDVAASQDALLRHRPQPEALR